ncbi:hypothetical protein [Novosphingobium sp. Gsoil 351]|uniref:hypothetical protein n=1 Tax=Novosphingobium sp. Gsoil 351 TaxID=2675225 RepID=UPI0012B49208|nr:hypothetical protein [Novosphingobium sp. Gsoil 351]QGN56108.1 hypothetical protein GKE62_17715 [Novosphingobium sp. Gsoil 351]
MSPPSSSISSFDERAARRRGWVTIAWVALWLAILDVGVNVAFAYPNDPKNLHPSKLALYFDYGRSMEGRLRRITRSHREFTAPITLAGWYDPLVAVERPAKPGATEVTIYGMSHAVRLADALQATPTKFQARSVGAPGATTNWSYGAFLRDPDRRHSKVAVLAIMSSTLPMILSPSPMDWNTSFAMPYTADRFIETAGGLRQIKPPYESFPEYVSTFNDPPAWTQALEQFARTDPFYDSFLFRASWLDNSTLVRLIRRAWAQRRDREWRNRALTAQSHDRKSEPVRIANAIVIDFARRARAEGIVPVIYIIDSFGYGDQLTRALCSTLAREQIPYVSTSQHIDPKTPTNYLPDGHFTDANDRKLAATLAQVMDRELAKTAIGR